MGCRDNHKNAKTACGIRALARSTLWRSRPARDCQAPQLGRRARCSPRRDYGANGCSLRDLYRTLETPSANRLRDAHAALDSAVRAAEFLRAQ